MSDRTPTTTDATPKARKFKHKVLNTEGDLNSLGYLSVLLQRDPRHVVQVAAELELRPLAIDGSPYFNNDQCEAIRQFFATHNVREVRPDADAD